MDCEDRSEFRLRMVVLLLCLIFLCLVVKPAQGAAPDPVGPWSSPGVVCPCPGCEECGVGESLHTHTCWQCGAAWSHGGASASAPNAHNCPYCGAFQNVVSGWGNQSHGPTRYTALPRYGAPDPIVSARPTYTIQYVKDCSGGGCRMIPVYSFAPNNDSFAPNNTTQPQTRYFSSSSSFDYWAQSSAIQTSASASAIAGLDVSRLRDRPAARLLSIPLKIATAPLRFLRGGCGR